MFVSAGALAAGQIGEMPPAWTTQTSEQFTEASMEKLTHHSGDVLPEIKNLPTGEVLDVETTDVHEVSEAKKEAGVAAELKKETGQLAPGSSTLFPDLKDWKPTGDL